MLITAALAIGIPGGGPEPALGSSLRVNEATKRMTYLADAGERNDLNITATVSGAGESQTVSVLAEDVVPIQPGVGCVWPDPDDRRTARCVRDYWLAYTLDVRLGDGNDRVELLDNFDGAATVRGGPGGDTLIGGPGPDLLVGGRGDDRMFGGEGHDRFNEGQRANGADTMYGGPSLQTWPDTVDYGGRRGRIRADLDGKRDDGGRHEADLIGGDVEQLVGGGGDDRLGGNREENFLVGGAGVDSIAGRGGDDRLYADEPVPSDGQYPPAPKPRGTSPRTDDRLLGGSGTDLLVGSAGDNLIVGGPSADYIDAGEGTDRVRGLDFAVDFVSCGPGLDAARNDPFDFLTSCERAYPLSGAAAVPIALQSGDGLFRETWFKVLLGCRRSRGQRCTGTMQLELGGEPVAPETSFEASGAELTTVDSSTYEPLPFETLRRTDLVVVIRSRDRSGSITRQETPVPRLQLSWAWD
jgi:Ca2+-binding RTX toxin-like protein